MRTLNYLYVFVIVLMISSCNTTIYPEANGTYSSVTTSSAQYSAESNAQKDTENYCKKMGKRPLVMNHKTSYYGTTTGNKIVGGIVGGLIGIPNPAISSSDYEVKTRFQCN